MKSSSAGEHGTMYQLRNLLARTNVNENPQKDFNACDDFFQLIITSHILAASLEFLKMESLIDTPSEDVISDSPNIWMNSAEDRVKILTEVCDGIIDKFISFDFNEDVKVHRDKVYDYGKQLLSLGCFYLEYADAIKEGDGHRILRCWKYLLPIFKSSGHTNYSIEAMNMLCQCELKLTPRQSAELLWNRFVNVHGLPGRNISSDLHQEHLNRVCKDAVRGLGTNQTERSIGRVGKALGTLSPVLDQYDQVNRVPDYSGMHKKPTSDRDRDVIIKQLQEARLFTDSDSSREHSTFKKPRNVLHSLDTSSLIAWMKVHL